jgi:hypothetical protein
MTQERAKEIIAQQAQWPHWGNFCKFCTPDEEMEINRLWLRQPGHWSRASVVYAIARGIPLE